MKSVRLYKRIQETAWIWDDVVDSGDRIEGKSLRPIVGEHIVISQIGAFNEKDVAWYAALKHLLEGMIPLRASGAYIRQELSIGHES